MTVKALAAAVIALAAATGCGASTNAPQPANPNRLVVFAASSLKQSFTAIGERFETEHPGVEVDFTFAGSQDLVTKLSAGAQADVLAAADAKNMAKAEAANLTVGDPVKFATNVLTIAVANGNPKKIASFEDLAGDGVSVVVCGPQTSCGSATERVAKIVGVQLRPVGVEASVGDVLEKVAGGRADAGIVYVTDVAGSGGRVTGVNFAESRQAVNTYPIVTIRAAAHEQLAKTFVDYVTGAAGRKVLVGAGFGMP